MKRLEQGLVRLLEISFGVCFVIMFVLVVTQVALRYGFNESIGGANELATILFAYTSAQNQGMIRLFHHLPYKVTTAFDGDMVTLKCNFSEPLK